MAIHISDKTALIKFPQYPIINDIFDLTFSLRLGFINLWMLQPSSDDRSSIYGLVKSAYPVLN
jgi:hypothetical protein